MPWDRPPPFVLHLLSPELVVFDVEFVVSQCPQHLVAPWSSVSSSTSFARAVSPRLPSPGLHQTASSKTQDIRVAKPKHIARDVGIW